MQLIPQVTPEQIAADDWPGYLTSNAVFLLADATFNRDVMAIAEHQSPEDLTVNRLYWGEMGRLHASLSPYLIKAHTANWAQLAEQICAQSKWGMAWVLEGQMMAYTPEQQLLKLMGHIRSWTLVADEHSDSSQEAALLRLWDPEVLASLMVASTEDDITAFYGPASSLLHINENGIFRHHWPKAGITLNDKLDAPRRLSKAQYLALDNHNRYRRQRDFLAHLNAHHPETQYWSEADAHEFIDAGVEQAQNYGFLGKQQQIKWLTLAVLFGADFAEQAWAKDVITARAEGEQSRMQQLYRAAEVELDKEVTHD
ncbi:DUF4123 domain-containing protein [Shewanella khirikhana]|uniref:DUF4123 domain-containing protein n=1 Tax=Shewanella khirikhana TaxID=1965282 RepID=UPI0030CEBF94